MSVLDSGEPFGLPQGTVRGIIAIAFTGLVVFQFATTGTASAELLAVAGPYLGFYFAGRQADNATKVLVSAVAPEVLPEPVTTDVVLGDPNA